MHARLGCYVGSTIGHGQGIKVDPPNVSPPNVSHTEHYWTHTIEIDRPEFDSTDVPLKCERCGGNLVVRVRSRSSVLKAQMIAALVLLLSIILAYLSITGRVDFGRGLLAALVVCAILGGGGWGAYRVFAEFTDLYLSLAIVEDEKECHKFFINK